MPYIKQNKRAFFDDSLTQLITDIITNQDDDNNSIVSYIIYKILKYFYASAPTWEIKSDALKVLEDVKLEYYRRVIAPYSDIKIEQNGDV